MSMGRAPPSCSLTPWKSAFTTNRNNFASDIWRYPEFRATSKSSISIDCSFRGSNLNTKRTREPRRSIIKIVSNPRFTKNHRLSRTKGRKRSLNNLESALRIKKLIGPSFCASKEMFRLRKKGRRLSSISNKSSRRNALLRLPPIKEIPTKKPSTTDLKSMAE